MAHGLVTAVAEGGNGRQFGRCDRCVWDHETYALQCLGPECARLKPLLKAISLLACLFGPDFASTSATSFWKSARPRRASKSGSFSSLGKAQPAPKASRREATAWSANLAASAAVTPDFASPPSPASRASARDRSNRVMGSGAASLAHSSRARRRSAAALDNWPDRTR